MRVVTNFLQLVQHHFQLCCFLCLHSPDKLEKREIEMKPNQAYETVTRAQPKAEVHTKPCPAYEVVAHVHH